MGRGENSQKVYFKPGNKEQSKNRGVQVHPKKPQDFVQKCRDFIYGGEGNGDTVFTVLKDVAIGYKGVQASHRIESCKLILAYGLGKPKETILLKGESMFLDKTDLELMSDIKKLIIDAKPENGEIARVMDAERIEVEADSSGAVSEEGRGAV